MGRVSTKTTDCLNLAFFGYPIQEKKKTMETLKIMA